MIFPGLKCEWKKAVVDSVYNKEGKTHSSKSMGNVIKIMPCTVRQTTMWRVILLLYFSRPTVGVDMQIE